MRKLSLKIGSKMATLATQYKYHTLLTGTELKAILLLLYLQCLGLGAVQEVVTLIRFHTVKY